MKVLISCPYGLWSLLAQELKKLWFSPEQTFQTWTFSRSDMQGIMKINLRSRLANKAYLQIAEGKAETFDQLFDLVKKSDYGQFLSNTKLSLKVQSKHSQLSSLRTIQSVAHKALLESIAQFGKEEESASELFLSIENNIARLYLNTSGTALHQRGRRKQTWAAPLKENIAAALVLLAGWRFKAPLFDPFCGSGTIAIEAALLAKNVAPGLRRNFAFQQFKNFESWTFEAMKLEASKKSFEGKYQIFAFDKDPEMIRIARANAQEAGVAELIHFEQKDFLDFNLPWAEKSWLISNPPYGKRIGSQDLDLLYQKLALSFQGEVFGGRISSRQTSGLNKSLWSEKKLFNGNEECSFVWRKPM